MQLGKFGFDLPVHDDADLIENSLHERVHDLAVIEFLVGLQLLPYHQEIALGEFEVDVERGARPNLLCLQEDIAFGETNGVIAFTRTLGARKMLVAANLTGKPADGGKDVGSIEAYSYVIRDVK